MAFFPMSVGNKSTHRERCARVNMDAIDDALLEIGQWIFNEGPTVDYVDYDTEMRAARDAVPYIVDGGARQRDFYSCGCCSDLEQFDVAHSSREGQRIMQMRESTDVYATILSFLVGELARKEGRQCMWIDLFCGNSANSGRHGVIVQVWDRERDPEFFFEDLDSVVRSTTAIMEVAELHTAWQRAGVPLSYVVHTRQYFGGSASLYLKMEAPSSRDLIGRLCDDQKIALDLVLEVGALTSDADTRFSTLVPDVKRREYLKKLAALVQLDQGAVTHAPDTSSRTPGQRISPPLLRSPLPPRI